MRLLLAISSMRAGGAERVASVLCREWTLSGCAVTLLTTDSSATDFFPIEPGVRRVALSFPGNAIVRCAAIVRTIRQTIRESAPDAVIAFGDVTNVLCLAAARGLRVPVIVSERTDPRRYSPGRFWEILRRRLYPEAAALVVQTRSVSEWAREVLPTERVWTIGNPLAEWAATSLPVERHRIIAGMGRLSREKGFDILVRAFGEFAPAFPEWRLRLIGDGPERSKLQDLAAKCGISGRVEFRGLTPDPLALLNECSVFALPSRFEGYPNALLEAMGTGLAAIAADCPSGPGEIIEHGGTGWLVPSEDPEALAAALASLAANPEDRQRLGKAAQAIRQTADAGSIARQWLDCVESVRSMEARRNDLAA